MKKIISILFVLELLSCSNNSEKAGKPAGIDTSAVGAIIDTAAKGPLKPIFGYRFSIEGDFNGDGKKEMLSEHYIDSITGKETNKYFEDIEYDSIVSLISKKSKYCYIGSSDKSIDSVFISNAQQLFGLSFMHNEGDLDGNGTDELFYVVDWADWSSMNTGTLITFTKEGWKGLVSFNIHDWEIPPLPQMSTSYGLFGAEGVNRYEKEDTLNQRLEKDLLAFSFIKKIKTGVIQVSEMCMEDTDSAAVGDEVKRIIHLK